MQQRRHRASRRLPLLYGTAVALSLLAAPTAGLAQDAKEDVAVGEVEGVVVTARKREERLLDVPVAASVLGAQRVEQYATTDMNQVALLAPGVYSNRQGGASAGNDVRIRGIGVLGIDPSVELPVALVFDGMPTTRGRMLDVGIFDIQDIQILKGPQALFFGKNSPAGVVALTSKNPSREFEGYVRASYEFVTEDPVLEGAVSIPLTDTLRTRIAIRGEDMQGGYIRNKAGRAVSTFTTQYGPSADFGETLPGAAWDKFPKTKSLVGRWTLVWEPTDNFDANLKTFGSYFRQNSAVGFYEAAHCANSGFSYLNALSGALTLDPFGDCEIDRTVFVGAPSPTVLNNFDQAPEDGEYYNKARIFTNTLTLNYRPTDALTLTSVTGWAHLISDQFDESDHTSFGQVLSRRTQKSRTFTQEVRLLSDFASPVNGMIGVFYERDWRVERSNNRIYSVPLYPVPGPYFNDSNTHKNVADNYSETTSLFAQLTWDITSQLELAGGARWTKSDKESDIVSSFNWLEGAVGRVTLAPVGYVYQPRTSGENISPEATLTWKPRDNLTLYAAYKTGFLAGGLLNPGTLANYTALPLAGQNAAFIFDEETAEGFEGGIKGYFLDGRLSGDLTFFRYVYEGLQVSVYNPQAITFTINNAGRAINQGVDLQGQFKATDRLEVHGWVSYVDNKFDSFPNAACYSGQTAAQGCILQPNGARAQDLSGTRWGKAPLSANLGIIYDAVVGPFDLTFSADALYFSRSPTLNTQPFTATPAHTLVNAAVKLTPSGGDWDLELIGTNIFDETYVDPMGTKSLGAATDIYGIVNPPRQVRIQATRRF